MTYVNAVLSQRLHATELPVAVRTALGKPLRRAAPLTQLALIGALACLPEDQRQLPSALLWQSTRGPRLETIALLDEVCTGAAEPMPYDFLATQPAIAAAQIQPFLPGLQSAMHIPLDSEGTASWSLLLGLAMTWLDEGRFQQVLCAHLDSREDAADGHWLLIGRTPLEKTLLSLQIVGSHMGDALPDTPDVPAKLSTWLQQGIGKTLKLRAPATIRLALEFARL